MRYLIHQIAWCTESCCGTPDVSAGHSTGYRVLAEENHGGCDHRRASYHIEMVRIVSNVSARGQYRPMRRSIVHRFAGDYNVYAANSESDKTAARRAEW